MSDQLYEAAMKVLNNSYSPYSSIRVAAAVQGLTGAIYTGVNVENSNYSTTICAERNALFAGITAGEKTFKRMVIITDSPKVQSPCGSCRQVMKELSEKLLIDFYGPQGFYRQYTAEDLLPWAFTLKNQENI